MVFHVSSASTDSIDSTDVGCCNDSALKSDVGLVVVVFVMTAVELAAFNDVGEEEDVDDCDDCDDALLSDGMGSRC